LLYLVVLELMRVSMHQAEDGQYYQISEGCIPRFTSM